jgi:hypothetical protein
VFAATTAHASPEAPSAAREQDLPTAQQHFDAGRADIRAGRCDLAIEEFRASLEAAPNVGAWLNLGDCLETRGQLQEAYEAQLAAQSLAAEKYDTRMATARASAERIRATVVTLVMSAPSGVGSLELSVDGATIPRERWSSLLVAPRVRHTIVARAADSTVFSVEVSGRAGETLPIPITFGGTKPAAQPADESPSNTLRTSAFISAAAGVAAWIGAGAFGALASSARSDLAGAVARNPGCIGAYPNEKCDVSTRAALDPIHDRMAARATAASALFVGGCVLLVGGLAMVLFSPSTKPKTFSSGPMKLTW